MNDRNWTFTAYENGKPVSTEEPLNHEQALAALRAAIAGEDVLADERLRRANPVDLPEPLTPADLGAAAAFARVA